MSERKPHPDNDLIDELQEQGSVPGQAGSSGGDLQRDIGTRSELHNTPGASGRERVTAQDHPEAQAKAKGEKTIDRLAPGRQDTES
jgi:hypothetical protein